MRAVTEPMTTGAGAPPARRRRPRALWGLAGLLAFLSLGGFAGGIPLLLDPTGRGLGVETAWLERTPVDDYLLPGFFILGVYGFGGLVTLVGIVSRWSPGALRGFDRWSARHWSWWASAAIGSVLVIWIVYEYAVLPRTMWLMPTLLVTGALLVAFALLPSIRRYAAVP